MPRKTEFHSVEFLRKVRDRQVGVLAGKSPAEIVAYFSYGVTCHSRDAMVHCGSGTQAAVECFLQ